MAKISGYLSAELAATCNALGFYDGQKYHLEPHCRETVHDLIRYLRRDEGGSHEIRRYLGNAKILQTDLLPMVQCHSNDTQLLDLVLRLIVNLTHPTLLVYNEVVPTDKFDKNCYLEITSHLQQYKEAFNDRKSWSPFTERLGSLLSKEVEDRSDDDQRTIERILILVRNVLHIPSSSETDQRPDNDASIHDQVLWSLHQSGMLDLLLYISSSDKESTFFLHFLEILCLMLREQPPQLLANTASHRSAEEKGQDEEELLKIRQAESHSKLKKNKKYIGTRHSNFGGTFIIKNMKATSDNCDLIYHKPIHDSKYISLDSDKKAFKLPKNRQPLACESTERRSALSVRIILKQVCVEFLNAAYNPLMRHVREAFHRRRTQENDESYYFSAVRFFMEFNRHYNFQVKYVSETISLQTFQFVQTYLEKWHEMMLVDKKKLPLWSYRSHLALKAYKELLYNLESMDRNDIFEVRESSKVIQSHIFYVIEYREMLLTLINLYKREKYSRKYLVDLIETVHIFIKLLCNFTKGKKLMVQKTAVRRKRAKKNKKSANKAVDKTNLESIWNSAQDELALVLTSSTESDVVPFDATLDLDMDQQKLEAIKKIQLLLKNGNFKEAVELTRASRDVWPENDTFGSSHAEKSEEIEILYEIFMADLGSSEEREQNDSEGSDNENEEEGYPTMLEQNFDVADFLKRFANPKVVKVCNYLLDSYTSNSDITNHCVVKMLYRIAWECKLPAMLFQASLFIKFQNILANYEPKYKELAKLAVHIVRKFVEVAEKNETVFVELLFPKHVKDAFEIVDGYGSYQSNKEKKLVWEEHEEEELKRLHEEYVRNNIEQDKVNWIMENIIDKNRSRRGVIKKMKELGLEVTGFNTKTWTEEQEEEVKGLYSACDDKSSQKLIVKWIFEHIASKDHNERDIKKKLIEIGLLEKPKKKLTTWTEEQDEELTDLFHTHKNDGDPLSSIKSILENIRSSQNIIAALLRLELIQDKKEVHKRRKSGNNKSSTHENSDEELNSNQSDTEDEDSDQENTTHYSQSTPQVPSLKLSSARLFEELSKFPYLKGGLKWLENSLSDSAEDIEDSDAEIPLLPLMEEPILSMENDVFTDFLLSLGLQKPIPNQEVYWRIPSTWSAQDYKEKIVFVKMIITNAGRSSEAFQVEQNQLLFSVGETLEEHPSEGNSIAGEYNSKTPNAKAVPIEEFGTTYNNGKRELLMRKMETSSDSDNDLKEEIQHFSTKRKRSSFIESDEESRDGSTVLQIAGSSCAPEQSSIPERRTHDAFNSEGESDSSDYIAKKSRKKKRPVISDSE